MERISYRSNLVQWSPTFWRFLILCPAKRIKKILVEYMMPAIPLATAIMALSRPLNAKEHRLLRAQIISSEETLFQRTRMKQNQNHQKWTCPQEKTAFSCDGKSLTKRVDSSQSIALCSSRTSFWPEVTHSCRKLRWQIKTRLGSSKPKRFKRSRPWRRMNIKMTHPWSFRQKSMTSKRRLRPSLPSWEHKSRFHICLPSTPVW